MAHLFTPPNYRDRSTAREYAKSVLITDGEARSMLSPSLGEVTGADPGSGYGDRAVFLGGRTYEVTDDEARILQDAGFEVRVTEVQDA